MTSARIRVFLVTYKRPALLRRALRGLLAQTFTNWVCELHNDAPDDGSPLDALLELAPGDKRFEYHRHETNQGPVATFNQVFRGGPEPYASLLEDDNWWEPSFLSRMLAVMDSQPDAALGWANMRIWHEKPDGTWRDSGASIWSHPGTGTQVFNQPEVLQALDALHSIGAMVFRPRKFATDAVPPHTPIAIIEPVRERAARGPLLFVPDVLANFAVTRHSTRTRDAVDWMQAKLLCAASFFNQVRVPDECLRLLWNARRAQRPPDTDVFFYCAIVLQNAAMLRFARPSDWIGFILRAARHPLRVIRVINFKHDHAELWRWLKTHGTSNVAAESTVIRKQDFRIASHT